MPEFRNPFFWLICLWLLVFPTTSGSCAQAQWIEPALPSKNSVWLLGIDLSRSVPERQFENYSKFLRRAVLPLLQAEDTVIVLPFPSEVEPITFEVAKRRSKLRETVLEIDAHIASLEQAPGKKHSSNLGTLLEYMNQRMINDSKLARVESFRYLIVLITDGILDGAQGKRGGALPSKAEYRILILGISDDKGDEDALIDLARDNGFERQDSIFITPYSQVDGVISGLGSFLDLRANPNLANLFAASTSR